MRVYPWDQLLTPGKGKEAISPVFVGADLRVRPLSLRHGNRAGWAVSTSPLTGEGGGEGENPNQPSNFTWEPDFQSAQF